MFLLVCALDLNMVGVGWVLVFCVGSGVCCMLVVLCGFVVVEVVGGYILFVGCFLGLLGMLVFG